jgi:hypothetical protein
MNKDFRKIERILDREDRNNVGSWRIENCAR